VTEDPIELMELSFDDLLINIYFYDDRVRVLFVQEQFFLWGCYIA